MITDTLPVGMRGNTPVVTSVTRGGVTLTEGVNYTVGWNPGTGALIVDLTAGSAGPTSIPAGGSLVVRYTASASNDAGAGATLTNSAVAAYNSWSGCGRRCLHHRSRHLRRHGSRRRPPPRPKTPRVTPRP